MSVFEIGSFPFLKKKGKIYVMLVTNISGNLWILPKGHPEDSLKNHKVAELETYEEAGVTGILAKSLNREFKNECGGTLLIYPLSIKKTLTEWKEKSKRKRKLVKVKEALQLVTRKEHLNAIKHFSSKVTLEKLMP
ncbi:MAG: hypothetical protein KZQ83_16220 [gamma proteobacterium symbiont of Taylorina sp.]|nr:hypothetical protein [gamma proteobacterium symbiont of Taylorina sp.]